MFYLIHSLTVMYIHSVLRYTQCLVIPCIMHYGAIADNCWHLKMRLLSFTLFVLKKRLWDIVWSLTINRFKDPDWPFCRLTVTRRYPFTSSVPCLSRQFNGIILVYVICIFFHWLNDRLCCERWLKLAAIVPLFSSYCMLFSSTVCSMK